MVPKRRGEAAPLKAPPVALKTPPVAPKAAPSRPAIAAAPDALSATPAAPPDKFARFAAVAAVPAPANDNADGLEAPPETVTSDKATLGKLVEIVGPLAPQLLVGFSATIVRWAGRVPEVPDQEIVSKLQECTDIILRQKLPNMEIGPWSGLAIYGSMTFLSMYMGAQKLPPKQLLPAAKPPQQTTMATDSRAPADTPGAVRDIAQNQAQSPDLFSVPPDLSESGSVGTVTTGFGASHDRTEDAGSAI
jgi:hypothetical protein